MRSVILETTARMLLPLLALFSLFLLVRGHDHPGGGFAGALVALSAVGLVALSYGGPAARRVLRVRPSRLIGAGLLLALTSAFLGLLASEPFFSAHWVTIEVAKTRIEAGTPLLFEAGVYLTVLGAGLLILLPLSSDV